MVDLNIDNYELRDILHLFKIPADFNESELKRAKQIVLKTHPDKSKLDPEYFRFYSKAYKMLYNIWEFRKLGDVDNTNKNTDYINDSEEEKKIILDNFFEKTGKFKNSNEFNGWFNDQFERNKDKDIEKGYGEWFKNEDTETDADNNNDRPVTMATMAQEFEKKKTVARSKSLIEYQGIRELYSASSYACELSTDQTETFSSDLFSNLAYQDLHQAHTQTVIPVTDEDFASKQKFNNVNEFMSHRNGQDTKPLSEQQAMQYLNNRTRKDEEVAVSRAYQLAKQTELAKQKNQEFWAGIKLIQ
jgi:hypothetical protein